MTRAMSPGWRHCGIVSCPDFPLLASSGVSAGCRTGILACRPLLRGRSAGRKSSPSPSIYRHAQPCVQAILRSADAFVCLEQGIVQNTDVVLSVRAVLPVQGVANCKLMYVSNFDTEFPFTQRNAKTEGEPKSLWQASSAPRCLAFAWPVAREGKPSRILSSYGNTAVDGMRGCYVRMCCITGRTGSF